MILSDAAARLGLSPSTLRVQIRNGRLAAVKRGRDWHVTPAELERYRAQSLGRRDPGSAAQPHTGGQLPAPRHPRA
jgi:excisionase family DNA binding protein